MQQPKPSEANKGGIPENLAKALQNWQIQNKNVVVEEPKHTGVRFCLVLPHPDCPRGEGLAQIPQNILIENRTEFNTNNLCLFLGVSSDLLVAGRVTQKRDRIHLQFISLQIVNELRKRLWNYGAMKCTAGPSLCGYDAESMNCHFRASGVRPRSQIQGDRKHLVPAQSSKELEFQFMKKLHRHFRSISSFEQVRFRMFSTSSKVENNSYSYLVISDIDIPPKVSKTFNRQKVNNYEILFFNSISPLDEVCYRCGGDHPQKLCILTNCQTRLVLHSNKFLTTSDMSVVEKEITCTKVCLAYPWWYFTGQKAENVGYTWLTLNWLNAPPDDIFQQIDAVKSRFALVPEAAYFMLPDQLQCGYCGCRVKPFHSRGPSYYFPKGCPVRKEKLCWEVQGGVNRKFLLNAAGRVVVSKRGSLQQKPSFNIPQVDNKLSGLVSNPIRLGSSSKTLSSVSLEPMPDNVTLPVQHSKPIRKDIRISSYEHFKMKQSRPPSSSAVTPPKQSSTNRTVRSLSLELSQKQTKPLGSSKLPSKIDQKPALNQKNENSMGQKVSVPCFKIGEKVYRKGKECRIVKVDHSVSPPFYIVKMESDGAEVNTEASRLSRTTERGAYDDKSVQYFVFQCSDRSRQDDEKQAGAGEYPVPLSVGEYVNFSGGVGQIKMLHISSMEVTLVNCKTSKIEKVKV